MTMTRFGSALVLAGAVALAGCQMTATHSVGKPAAKTPCMDVLDLFTASNVPEMGQAEMLNAFAAIILGGFGNVNGTILGALVIGMVQSVAAVYLSNAYSSSIAFALLVGTLMFFPRGLVPERLDENV